MLNIMLMPFFLTQSTNLSPPIRTWQADVTSFSSRAFLTSDCARFTWSINIHRLALNLGLVARKFVMYSIGREIRGNISAESSCSCLLDSRHLLRLLLHLGRLHLGGVRLLPNLKQVQHAWTSYHLQPLNKLECTLVPRQDQDSEQCCDEIHSVPILSVFSNLDEKTLIASMIWFLYLEAFIHAQHLHINWQHKSS